MRRSVPTAMIELCELFVDVVADYTWAQDRCVGGRKRLILPKVVASHIEVARIAEDLEIAGADIDRNDELAVRRRGESAICEIKSNADWDCSRSRTGCPAAPMSCPLNAEPGAGGNRGEEARDCLPIFPLIERHSLQRVMDR
jgi:hypothetical protein